MSRKKLEQVIGVQYSWSYFLWKWIDHIQTLRAKGQYDLALEAFFQLCELIPFDVYEVLEPKLEQAQMSFSAPIKTPVDPTPKAVVTRKVRMGRAKVLLSELMKTLRKLLDEKGYLERRPKPVPRGFELAEG